MKERWGAPRENQSRNQECARKDTEGKENGGRKEGVIIEGKENRAPNNSNMQYSGTSCAGIKRQWFPSDENEDKEEKEHIAKRVKEQSENQTEWMEEVVVANLNYSPNTINEDILLELQRFGRTVYNFTTEGGTKVSPH